MRRTIDECSIATDAIVASSPELSWNIATNFSALAMELKLLYLEIDAGLDSLLY